MSFECKYCKTEYPNEERRDECEETCGFWQHDRDGFKDDEDYYNWRFG